MEPVLGRVGLSLIAMAIGMAGSADVEAVMPIAEDELASYMTALGDMLTGCDVQGFGALMASSAQVTFVDSDRTDRLTRDEYLAFLQQFCKVQSPERGFKELSASYNVGGPTATLHFVIAKNYQLGLVRRRRINVTLYQEILVERAAQERLLATRISQRSEYRDVADGRIVPWEDAQPILPLNRLHRLLLGSWLLPADREEPSQK